MIVYLLLLGVCVFDTSAIIEPSYYDSLQNINKATQILSQEILSMDGDIPHLNDSRRHYAEILHVLYNEAKGLPGRCFPQYYDKDYNQILNVATPEGIRNPQKVINGIKSLIEAFNQKTTNMRTFITVLCRPEVDKTRCDTDISNLVNRIDFVRKEATIYLLGGYAAFALVQKDDEFLQASKEHNAHKYVLQGKEYLRNPSLRLFNLLDALGKVICDIL